jgi:hypothetical protein
VLYIVNDNLHRVKKRSSNSNSLYVEQRSMKMCLGENSEDEVTITRITSTPAHNESEDNGPTILRNTEDIITHLPEELLECIMLKLNYGEISKVRGVCRRFRDTGNNILHRQFHRLQDCIEGALADLAKEVNALPVKTKPHRRKLFRCRKTLEGIRSQVNILTAVGYRHRYEYRYRYQSRCRNRYLWRFILPGDEQPNVHYSTAFFPGNIIDEVHRILRNVKRREAVNLGVLRDLVRKWRMFAFIDS